MVYAASITNRTRATRAEMDIRFDQVYQLCEEHRPATVRNIYYRAVVAGITPKTNAGYTKIQRACAELRRTGRVPYSWIVDNARWMRRPNMWGSIAEFAEDMNSLYRRDMWTRLDERVEVWCESDSIAGVLYDITAEWGVPLFPVKGFSSITFTYSAALQANEIGKPVTILYVGDHDKSGLAIEQSLERDLVAHLNVPLEFRRIGVTWDQVKFYDLPGTPPKDPKGYPFPMAVEAEALPPAVLRSLLYDAIEEYVDEDVMRANLAAEESERAYLTSILGGIR